MCECVWSRLQPDELQFGWFLFAEVVYHTVRTFAGMLNTSDDHIFLYLLDNNSLAVAEYHGDNIKFKKLKKFDIIFHFSK